MRQALVKRAMRNNNQARNLSDIVSLEAWHDELTCDLGRSDLHVDVSFMTGRMGGGNDNPVRFKLTLRQAELVVVVPATEPVKVDPKSVRRDTRDRKATVTDTYKRSGKVEGATAAKVKLRSTGADVNFEAEGGVSGSASRDHLVEVSETVRSIVAVHGKAADGAHFWTLSPAMGDTLDGRPWDGVQEPRLTLVDTRKADSRSLPATVRVEVRCRREDLEISEIVLTDQKQQGLFKKDPNRRNKLAAAEALIRTRMFEEGLLENSADLNDPYARMTIAVVSAESV